MTLKQKTDKVLRVARSSFRGKTNSINYKNYILTLLFLKCLSDEYAHAKKKYSKQFGGDEEQIACALQRERFVMDETSTFDYLYDNRWNPAVGDRINAAFADIEKKNSEKLSGVFRAVDFTSAADFGEEHERNLILRNLLEAFRELDFTPDQAENTDDAGDAFAYLTAGFAADARRGDGDFCTPDKVCALAAKLIAPVENDRIYDASCGCGDLLLGAYRQAVGGGVTLYGQEQNMQTWALCRMNLFLHHAEDAVIWQGDTLSAPGNVEDGELMKFQCICAVPPFSQERWDSGFLSGTLDENGMPTEKMSAERDPFHRFDWGVPPASRGDYAYILHMLHSLDDTVGRMAIILPHGVLFRGAGEGAIRRTLIEEHNLLDAVIGLPANLLYGTGIPVCILVFRRDRGADRRVLFIDAGSEGNYEKGTKRNRLRECDVKKIADTYSRFKGDMSFTDEPGYSHAATAEEIAENGYNLNIPRYVNTFGGDESADIDEVRRTIAEIEAELAEVRAQMKQYLDELGLPAETV